MTRAEVARAFLEGDRVAPSGQDGTVVLIAQPEPEEFAETPRGNLLTDAWRRLFRARAQRSVRAKLESGQIDQVGLSERLKTIGLSEFEEVQAVLRKDRLLPPPGDVAAAYAAFAGIFLEQSAFAPALRGYAFPAIEDPEAVESLLAADADGPSLLASTKPAGAPEPSPALASSDDPTHGDPNSDRPEPTRPRDNPGPASPRLATVVAGRARAAAAKGNVVRAAILHDLAARHAGAAGGEAHRAAARASLKQLARRLQKALGLPKGEAERWAQALTPLLPHASAGFFTPEARLLYDLQKVCDDHEREVFRIDLLGWIFSFGRKPIKRPLPHLREVTVSNHLRSAERRLPTARVRRGERSRLEAVLRPAVRRAEHDLRERFRPRINATLGANWVRPRNLPERVAYLKLVEEMLDPIVARGFTTFGDLRDAASRGKLKLPDLAGPREFLEGDRLLRADEALAEALEGVHRRGEIYLRWLQRFSALMFGTPAGRFFTLCVALPFGGAYVALEGLQHLLGFVFGRLAGVHIELVEGYTVAALGTLALGAINFAWFRRGVIATLRATGRVLRTALIDWPAVVLNHPVLRRVLGSRLVTMTWRYAIKPMMLGSLAAGFGRVARLGPFPAGLLGLLAFLFASFVDNTAAGRALKDAATERLGHAARALAFDVVPGLFAIVMAAFAAVLERVERVIYAVDEWLRYRSGQSRALFATKAVLGAVWAAVAYVVRFSVNLLIEPQINPIKHFPVVTVSHKIILPLTVALTRLLSAVLKPLLGVMIGNAVAFVTVLLLPGVFGFLVWELKSNWRLYETNREPELGPVVVGGHGETIVKLLRPGFHSGTLPKLFAKLRQARRVGRERSALRSRESLHHAEEGVRRFIERDLVALLRESRSFGGSGVDAGEIRLATNRIRVELRAEALGPPGLWFDLEERRGTLAAGVSRGGWLDPLEPAARRAIDDALAGFWKMSGVEHVHTPGSPIPAGDTGGDLSPSYHGDGPTAQASLVFREVTIAWSDWVSAWESERAGLITGPLAGRDVLPGGAKPLPATAAEARHS